MSLRRGIQRVLGLGGYRLVRLSDQPRAGFDVVDEKRVIHKVDEAKVRGSTDLERWFHSETSVNTFKWQHYFDIYERHLARFRAKPNLKMLEIGVFRGGSLRMWKSYFGPAATIVGLDIEPTCKQYENAAEGIHVRIGDQESKEFLASVAEEFGPFDIILDDGGHMTAQQIRSFLHLYFSAMTPDGVYMVEDLHTNYWGFAKTYPDDLTFVDLAARLVHKLNDAYLGRSEDLGRFAVSSPNRFDTLEVSAFCAQTKSIHFYDSIITFERHPKTVPNLFNDSVPRTS